MGRKTKKLISSWQSLPLYVFLIVETLEYLNWYCQNHFLGKKFWTNFTNYRNIRAASVVF